MKIATWNLKRPERPKISSTKNGEIKGEIKRVDADIFVLTETSECIELEGYEKFSSDELESCSKSSYTPDDRRTTIWVKREYFAAKEVVSDPKTSTCVNVKTAQGALLIYGTVIGVFGHPSQNIDSQIEDWRKVSQGGKKSICIAGDFNLQFNRSDTFTNRSKSKISQCFTELKITNLTSGIAENVDHIAISSQFLIKAPHSETHLWNLEKLKRAAYKLSDHHGIAVSLNI